MHKGIEFIANGIELACYCMPGKVARQLPGLGPSELASANYDC